MIGAAALLAFGCLGGVAVADDSWPPAYSAEGGVLQPLGPQSLTPAKQRLRTQARRAIGLGAPDLTSARANLGRANRAADRAARAERSATLLRARAERLVPSAAAAAARAAAARQDAIAVTALEQQSERLDEMADDLSLATAATCAIPPQPSPYSIFTLPAWSDLAGWDARDQYGTIQLADVTGDGADEVLGRGADGVELSQMSDTTGVFSALPDGPPLSDAAGWDKDRFALTIRSGDISGDGQAEIIGLDGDGKVVTFLRDATSGAWTQLAATSTPAWDDKGTDWSDSTHYETLQLVDLDGDQVDELVARASRGIVAARFDSASSAWTPLNPGPELSDAAGWNRARYSSTIRFGDVDGQPGVELVALDGGPGVPVWSYDPTTDTWSSLGNGSLPAWPSGATDWGKPQYYETVRLADLDGDPRDVQELLVRSENGLVAARFDPVTFSWVPMRTSPVLSDVGGWDLPQYYESLRVGDVDGDGADEVFVRGEALLNVISYQDVPPTPAGGVAPIPWTVHSSAPLVSSAWGEASDYRAFRLGDVDGDGKDEVVGRDQYGVRTFRYVDGDLVSSATPFPEFSGPECAAYNAIAVANEDILQGTDLRVAYGDPSISLSSLSVPSARPAGVSPTAWASVSTQISKELTAARRVRNWHVGPNGMQQVITNTYGGSSMGIDAISPYFLPKKSQSVASEILPWLEAVVTAVGVAVEPEGAIAAEVTAAAVNGGLGFTFSFFEGKGQSTKVELNEALTTQDSLARKLGTMRQKAIEANTANETYIPREYGLMLAVDDARLPAGPAVTQTMWRQSNVFYWQTFTKALWNSSYCKGSVKTGLFFTDNCVPEFINIVSVFFDTPVDPWVRTRDDGGEAYWVGRGKSTANKQPDGFKKSPGQGLPAGKDVLFKTPSAACTPPFSATTSYTDSCRLGIPERDFYLGRDGWDLPRNRVTKIV